MSLLPTSVSRTVPPTRPSNWLLNKLSDFRDRVRHFLFHTEKEAKTNPNAVITRFEQVQNTGKVPELSRASSPTTVASRSISPIQNYQVPVQIRPIAPPAITPTQRPQWQPTERPKAVLSPSVAVSIPSAELSDPFLWAGYVPSVQQAASSAYRSSSAHYGAPTSMPSALPSTRPTFVPAAVVPSALPSALSTAVSTAPTSNPSELELLCQTLVKELNTYQNTVTALIPNPNGHITHFSRLQETFRVLLVQASMQYEADALQPKRVRGTTDVEGTDSARGILKRVVEAAIQNLSIDELVAFLETRSVAPFKQNDLQLKQVFMGDLKLARELHQRLSEGRTDQSDIDRVLKAVFSHYTENQQFRVRAQVQHDEASHVSAQLSVENSPKKNASHKLNFLRNEVLDVYQAIPTAIRTGVVEELASSSVPVSFSARFPAMFEDNESITVSRKLSSVSVASSKSIEENPVVSASRRGAAKTLFVEYSGSVSLPSLNTFRPITSAQEVFSLSSSPQRIDTPTKSVQDAWTSMTPEKLFTEAQFNALLDKSKAVADKYRRLENKYQDANQNFDTLQQKYRLSKQEIESYKTMIAQIHSRLFPDGEDKENQKPSNGDVVLSKAEVELLFTKLAQATKVIESEKSRRRAAEDENKGLKRGISTINNALAFPAV